MTQFGPHLDNDDFIMKMKVMYLFKYEEIYGTLLIKKDCLVYEPFSHKADLKGEYDFLASNEKLMESATDENQLNLKLQDYTAKIDFLDIIECNKLPLVNEKAVMSESHEVKDAYKYNIFLQLVLGTVNGITIRGSEEGK